MTTLADLVTVRRWIAWCNERRGGKLTKVPYCAVGRQAESNNPETWLAHDAAVPVSEAVVNGLGGGLGIMLGGFEGVWLGGIDLDTCRDPSSGAIEPWATEVIYRFATYAEVSPSGSGVKLFFDVDAADVREMRRIMRTEHGRQFKRRGNGVDHPPAIELYISNRYFAVTWHALDDALDLRTVPLADLLWLIEDVAPRFVGKKPGRRGRYDDSRSAKAFRLGAQLRREGKSFDEMCKALHELPDTAEWYREKGDGRQLRRIWDRAAPAAEWLSRCQTNDKGMPLANLANALTGLREAPGLQGLLPMTKCSVPPCW
jgi:putative DNA primase/helicase